MSGQGTVEWIGLVLLVSLTFLGLFTSVGGRLPGVALGGAIVERILCATHLGDACTVAPLSASYGSELAGLVTEHAPVLRYEPGMRALPVDYRRCREDACAEGAESGLIWRSRSGEPVAAFTHVVDCRTSAGDLGGAGAPNCAGRRAGNLYLQYWFYYPGSATGEGSIPGVKKGIRWVSTRVGKPSYHRDDWESYQLRIGPRGEVLSRASSHQGHVYSGNPRDALGRARDRLPGRPFRVSQIQRGAWGPSTGSLYVSGGSHAGRVGTSEAATRVTPGSRIRLIPLEALGDRARYAFAVTAPWLKNLWRDPEADSTD